MKPWTMPPPFKPWWNPLGKPDYGRILPTNEGYIYQEAKRCRGELCKDKGCWGWVDVDTGSLETLRIEYPNARLGK